MYFYYDPGAQRSAHNLSLQIAQKKYGKFLFVQWR